MNGDPSGSPYGPWLLVLGALVGLGLSIFNYVWTGNGIHGTPGALLVVVSAALMGLAALELAIWPDTRRWLRVLLLTLIGLDIVGTALAAYMLEAEWLIAAMALAFIGWLVHLTADPAPRSMPAGTVTSGAAASGHAS